MSNNPTAEQRRRWSRICEHGCLACMIDGNPGTPGEIHHCKEHGRRMHSRTVCLCPPHHKPTSAIKGVLNRHLNPIEFRDRYGSDVELHKKTCELLGESPD